MKTHKNRKMKTDNKTYIFVTQNEKITTTDEREEAVKKSE